MNASLQGKRILVTRPAAQAGELAALIAEQGGEPVLFPLLDIAPAEDWQPLLSAVERLGDYAVAVFVSPNAVACSLPRILSRGPWPPGLPAAATGPGTAEKLAGFGIRDVLVPAGRYDSEALLELRPLQAECVAGRKVLILRGDGGREWLASTLRERGAAVDCVTCYRRSAPVDASRLVSLLRNNGLDAVTVSSSEALRNLQALLDTVSRERLLTLPVFVPHGRIADAAAKLGLTRVVLTRPADAGIVEGLCAYDWAWHEPGKSN